METELNIQLQLEDPFYLVTECNIAERSNMKLERIKAKQSIELTILFDATNYNDQKCHRFSKKLFLSYSEHDCTVSSKD